MRQKKFRQPIYNHDGSFREWFYWGLFIEDGEWVNIHCASRHYNLEQKITDPLDSQEFTGLTDKNGKEIYEGDICRTHDWVRQDDGSTILSDEYKFYKNVVIEYKLKSPFPGYVIHSWYEVIGNVHENPELLNPHNANK